MAESVQARPNVPHMAVASMALGQRAKPEGKPLPAQMGTLDQFTKYLARAKTIGYQPAENHVAFERLKLILAEKNILVYDDKAVEAWLVEVLKKERLKHQQSNLMLVWRPLGRTPTKRRSEYRYQFQRWDYSTSTSRMWGSITWKTNYEKVIPDAVLATAETILASFTETDPLCLFVSDYELVQPDPFLAVAIPGFPFLMVDFWDEPGFKPVAAPGQIS